MWSKSAISKFILDNNLGFCVDSLRDINGKLSNLTDEQYLDMLKNVEKFSKQISNGEFLTSVIKQIEGKIQ